MNIVKSSTDTENKTDEMSPTTFDGKAILRDGTHVRVRPIHPEDIELERRFIESLSPESRRFRFLDTMISPSEALLKQMTDINPATDAAFVVLQGTGDQTQEIGVARLSALPDGHDCEFAVTVADAWQHKGIGTMLVQKLIEVAKSRGINAMHSNDSADNYLMRRFAEHLHFQHEQDPEDATMVIYSVRLDKIETVSGSV